MLRYAVFLLSACSLLAQTNNSIALGVTTPKFADPVQQIMEVQRIRNLQMQERLQAEEVRRLQLENQARSSAANVQPVPQPKSDDAKPADAETGTHGLENGRFWKGLSRNEKTMFVIGFSTGVGITNAPNSEVYVTQKLTNQEITEGLNRFYAEPENLLVPMCLSVMILAKKTSGAEQAEIDSQIAGARRWSLQPLESAPAK